MQSPRIFATVVVIKLARIIWAERLNERPDSQATVMSLRPASRIAGLSKRRIRERLRIVTTAAMIMTMMADHPDGDVATPAFMPIVVVAHFTQPARTVCASISVELRSTLKRAGRPFPN